MTSQELIEKRREIMEKHRRYGLTYVEYIEDKLKGIQFFLDALTINYSLLTSKDRKRAKVHIAKLEKDKVRYSKSLKLAQ